jgi:predicted PurR-regulated permease PerM
VLLGVFGGVFAFGFIGVFLGPIFLAVGWSVGQWWLASSRASAGQPLLILSTAAEKVPAKSGNEQQ